MVRPILFNSDMVRAILERRKTVTRRVIKDTDDSMYAGLCGLGPGLFDKKTGLRVKEPYYRLGDILYVRETWCRYGKLDDFDHVIDGTEKYYYLADGANPTPYNCFLVQRNGYDEYKDTPVWHPSIHMPKEAARIWLKVTDIRVERLQDIDGKGCVKEGIEEEPLKYVGEEFVKGMYHDLWDSTIKKSDIDRYGWDANPWVWVIDFERCDKPKEE